MGEGKYAACAEVCPTGATLYGKVKDLHEEAKRRVALKPGAETKFPRGNINTHDQSSHTAKAAAYLPQIYGEKELGGTQMMKLSAVPFDKLGMPKLPERSYAATSETMQHTLYGNALVLPLAFLGALTYVAKRNVKHDDDAGDDKK
jgi:ferredoxin